MPEAFTITATIDPTRIKTWTRNNKNGAIELAQNLVENHGYSKYEVVVTYTESGDIVEWDV